MGWRDAIANAVLRGARGGPREGGIMVYHQSPFDFEKFSNKAIGTGEGAQTYGYGHYFAENPAVSGQGGQYWEQFANRFPEAEQQAATQLQNFNFDRAQAIADTQATIADWQRHLPGGPSFNRELFSPQHVQDMIAGHQDILNRLQNQQFIGPRTYEVNINARPDLFLNWDQPLSAQPDVVKNAFRKVGLEPDAPNLRELIDNAKGLRLHSPQGGSQVMPVEVPDIRSAGASRAFNEAGVPGIRYLDQGSRPGPAAATYIDKYGGRDAAIKGVEQQYQDALSNPNQTRYFGLVLDDLRRPQTSNYVVFDPGLLDIKAKYGIAGGLPLGAGTMGAIAAQDQYDGAQQ